MCNAIDGIRSQFTLSLGSDTKVHNGHSTKRNCSQLIGRGISAVCRDVGRKNNATSSERREKHMKGLKDLGIKAKALNALYVPYSLDSVTVKVDNVVLASSAFFIQSTYRTVEYVGFFGSKFRP